MLLAPAAQALEKVTLQLKHTHQFQFAGYYAALEEGYFEDEGLYVTLEAQSNWKVVLDRVISGELDVALIVVSQLQNRQALETETILRSGWRVWFPVNHRLAVEEKIEATELAQQSLILLQVDELGDATTALWNAGGSDPSVLIRTSSVEAVRSLVREQKTFQIPSTISTSRKDGMQTLDQHLLELVQKKTVTIEEAMKFSEQPMTLMALLMNMTLPLGWASAKAPTKGAKTT